MADVLAVGLTTIEAVLTGPDGRRETVEFLIDSGASYTVLPHAVWMRLGLKPKWTMQFQMADGTSIERPISECHLALSERDGHTPVILGEPGDVALLGVITLEQFALVFYPFDRSLRRQSRAMLATTRAA